MNIGEILVFVTVKYNLIIIKNLNQIFFVGNLIKMSFKSFKDSNLNLQWTNREEIHFLPKNINTSSIPEICRSNYVYLFGFLIKITEFRITSLFFKVKWDSFMTK